MFSVVIPLYNKENYIRKTIESVFNQEYSQFELIVVDDGSTDNSLDVVKSINDRRLNVISQVNAGEGAARNTGIRASNYEYVAFLDGDDFWDAKHLTIIKRLIDKYPNCGLFASNYQISANGELRSPKFSNLSQEIDQEITNYFKVVQIGDQIVNSSNSCIPLNVLNEVGYFKINEPLGTDLDMWGRVALQYNVAFSLEVGSYYNQGASDRACDIYISIDELPFGRFIRPNLEKLNDYRKIDQVYGYINKQLLERASANIKMGETKNARKLLYKYNGSDLKRKNFWLLMSWVPPTVTKMLRKIYLKLKY